MGVLHLNQEKEKMKQNAQRTTHVEQDIYHSRPTTIRAFQFTGDHIKPPQWFVEACHRGEISVTLNGKDKYITIYKGKGEMQRAYVMDWICCAEGDKIFLMGEKGFRTVYHSD